MRYIIPMKLCGDKSENEISEILQKKKTIKNVVKILSCRCATVFGNFEGLEQENNVTVNVVFDAFSFCVYNVK